MGNIKQKLSPIEEGRCPIGKFGDFSKFLDFCPECPYAYSDAFGFNLRDICGYKEKEEKGV